MASRASTKEFLSQVRNPWWVLLIVALAFSLVFSTILPIIVMARLGKKWHKDAGAGFGFALVHAILFFIFFFGHSMGPLFSIDGPWLEFRPQWRHDYKQATWMAKLRKEQEASDKWWIKLWLKHGYLQYILLATWMVHGGFACLVIFTQELGTGSTADLVVADICLDSVLCVTASIGRCLCRFEYRSFRGYEPFVSASTAADEETGYRTGGSEESTELDTLYHHQRQVRSNQVKDL